MALFDCLYAAFGESATHWQPTRSTGATAGRNDPAWTSQGAMNAVVDEHDAERRMSYGGPLGQRVATVFLSATDGATVNEGDLFVIRSVVWKVAAPPSQSQVAGHYECFVEEVQQPPTGVS